MYCPKCGQQQISDEMKFCSRCGLSMIGLAEWLSGSAPLAIRSDGKGNQLPSQRRKAMRRAGKLLFAGGVLFPLILVFSLIIDEGAPMIFPIVVLFIGLVMMIYARLFIDNTPPTAVQQTLFGSTAAPSLPPATSIPIQASGQRLQTNELAQPASVTENTTKLL